MNFIDEVKSPLDNDEFLKILITIYAEQNSKSRKSGSYIYDELIRQPESEAFEDKETYIENFRRYVKEDTICKVLTDALNYSIEDAKQIYQELFINGEEESKTLGIEAYQLLDLLEDKGCINRTYGYAIQESNAREILEEVFAGHGTMGYHIYESKFGNQFSFAGDTVKLYINAAADTYEFSKLFKEKCEGLNLPFMYKVANPEKDEHIRADKMCIYSSLGDIEKYIEIVKSIKEEHPDFDYRSPAPIMGSIDEWIGIGSDPENFALARSYSDSRAILFENSLRAVLGNASRNKIFKMLMNNPSGLVSKLKAEVKKRARAYSITKHFVFDDVIAQAFEIDDVSKRDEFYRDNRSNLFPEVAEDKRKSIFEKIRKLFPKKSKRKSKDNPPEHQLTIPERQEEYGHAHVAGSDDFIERLRFSPPGDNDIPMEQTPLDRGESKTSDKNDPDDQDHDSDVWI